MLTLATTPSPSGLQQFWFAVIAILWLGYFFLEGFDFGVGILMPFVTKDDLDRRVLVNAIGPVWDGNEVWLLTAGGAIFAAFPLWYATVFSGFYLALFLVLAALIFRGMAFEFRGKRDSVSWRKWWDRAIFWGSALPALLWGVAFADFVAGVPIGADATWTGTFFDLVKPYALVGGLTSLSLFTLHGANFLSLKTDGEIKDRVRAAANLLAPIAFGVLTVFLVWTYITAHTSHDTGIVPPFVPIISLVAAAATILLVREKLDGWAFVSTALAVLTLFATLFLLLYPNVLNSSVSHAYDISISQAASHPYTLKVMTVVALIFTPIVLIYQSWTYWVFRSRVRRPKTGAESAVEPVDAN
jgi:cytochrome d ubiquinol oxidase subunit II